MSTPELLYKEKTTHGSQDFPCSYYYADERNFLPDAPFLCRHHWHDEVEFLYFEKGCFNLEINMEKFHMEEECFCFVGSGELHAITGKPGFAERALVFSPSMLDFAANDNCQLQLLLPLTERRLSLPRIVTSKNTCFPMIRQAWQTILSCFSGHTSADCRSVNSCFPENNGSAESLSTKSSAFIPVCNQLGVKAAILSILAALGQDGLLTSTDLRTDQRVPLIKQTLSYMNEHFRERIYISDLAALVNMNEQYFCRFFRKSIGKPPIEYLNELRIRHAMRMLQRTDDSVMEIALECGFNNLGNFMRTFKKQTQTTPLQYRKSIQR